MSGVAIIRYLLANNAGVIAVAPAAQIFGGTIPLNTPAPAIGVEQISGVERHTVSMVGTKKLRTERVQVTVKATTYAEQKSLMELARTACANRNGTTNGFDLDSILPAGEGPDGFDPDAGIYEQTRDFMVKWRSS